MHQAAFVVGINETGAAEGSWWWSKIERTNEKHNNNNNPNIRLNTSPFRRHLELRRYQHLVLDVRIVYRNVFVRAQISKAKKVDEVRKIIRVSFI